MISKLASIFLALYMVAVPAFSKTADVKAKSNMQPVRILVVGDSLSAEYGLKRGSGWVALLENRLAESVNWNEKPRKTTKNTTNNIASQATNTPATADSASMGAAASAAGAAGTAAADAASVKVENGVVKFYFASGKSEVATGGNEALAEVVKAIAGGKKAVVSGFNDATGDAAKNAELSKARAFAVRDALKALGVAEDKIELKKPENTTAAAGSSAEARRVEVSIQ